MPGLNDDIADDIAVHHIAIESANSATRSTVAAELRRMEEELELAILRAANTTTGRPTALLAQGKQVIAETMKKARGLSDAELADLAEQASLLALESIQSTLTTWPFATLNAAELRSIVAGNAIEGTPLRDWWNGQAVATQNEVRSDDQPRGSPRPYQRRACPTYPGNTGRRFP